MFPYILKIRSHIKTIEKSIEDLVRRRIAPIIIKRICERLCILPKIGQLFGNRDHTTVMYANKKITELMKERRSIYNQVTELTSRIKQNNRP